MTNLDREIYSVMSAQYVLYAALSWTSVRERTSAEILKESRDAFLVLGRLQRWHGEAWSPRGLIELTK